MTARISVFVAGVAIAAGMFAVAINPWLIRILLAVAIASGLGLISLRQPRIAVLLVLALLPWLALVRRVLIPLAGWTSWDALLVVAPAVSIVIAHRLFMMERRLIARDMFSKLVFALLVLAVLGIVNPAGGGLLAGAIGLLFLGAPLIWYFIGRELADRRFIGVLLASTALAGAVTAAYGLMQQQVGFPSWDAAWINLNGYGALSILGATRAFGTFSSSAEYATFVAAALLITLVAVLSGRRRWLLALPIVPLLAYALFLASARGVVVMLLIATAVVLALRTGRLPLTLLFLSAAAVGSWAAIQVFGPQLTEMALRSGNPFVAHQVAGLMNPFDPEQSTYFGHQQMALDGVVTGVLHPLGLGTAAATLAGSMLAGSRSGMELDVPNAFVGLGLPGGILFSTLLLITLWRVGRLGISNRDAATLATVGVLLVTLGQWLNGSYYAIAPLVWVLIGWVTKSWLRRQALNTARERRGGVEPRSLAPSAPVGVAASTARL